LKVLEAAANPFLYRLKPFFRRKFFFVVPIYQISIKSETIEIKLS
jgi:hypothetical protein